MKNYRKVRELEKRFILERIASTEKIEKLLTKTYKQALVEIENEIDLASITLSKNGEISRTEANSKIDKGNIDLFNKTLKKTDLSQETKKKLDSELRSFDINTKTTKQTLLQKKIELIAIETAETEEAMLNKFIASETKAEIERQNTMRNLLIGLGIIGIINKSKSDVKTIDDSFQKKLEKATTTPSKITNEEISNAYIHGAISFSDRIWDNSKDFINAVNEYVRKSIRKSAHPNVWADKLKKYVRQEVDRATYVAKRLMATEIGNAQINIQFESLKINKFDSYIFVCEPGACPVCLPLDGKVFKMADATQGENAPLMHPWCRCSISASVE